MDDEEAEQARGLFYQTGFRGALESRYIGKSLGVRLDTYNLSDQIKIVQLMNRATPAQMESITALGHDTIAKAAQCMEFLDDLAAIMLNLAETDSEITSKVFEQLVLIISAGTARQLLGILKEKRLIAQSLRHL